VICKDVFCVIDPLARGGQRIPLEFDKPKDWLLTKPTEGSVAEAVFPVEPVWRTIFASMPAALMVIAPDGRIVFANEAAVRWFGPAPSVSVLGHAEDRASSADPSLSQRLDALFQGAANFEIPQWRLRISDQRAQVFHVYGWRAEPTATECFAVLTLHEIAELLTAEERLAVTERLAAVGKLAAKVAHELNNPLDGIMRYIALAQRRLRNGQFDDVERYLDDAQFGLRRMADILRELLDVGRNSSLVRKASAIDYLIQQSVHTMSHVADRNNVKIVVSSNDTMQIRAGINVYQVLCNLIKNSLDAMPSGGTMEIITHREGPYAVIRVLDTGPGIDPADLPYIFEPFFSTKPHGGGTGLGLPICKELIERMGGTIAGKTRDEGGCEFVIRLPAGEREVLSAAATVQREAAATAIEDAKGKL
jgi:signal transduction histidine kinase